MFSNAKNIEIDDKIVKSIILENGRILYEKDEPYILSITSDKNILSYYDNDVATLTVNYTKDGIPYSGPIYCSTFPDFFDGTNLYIPFEKGDEDWMIGFGGTINILNEDKTLYRTLTASQIKYISYQNGAVTAAEYMQDSESISLPTKGFFVITIQQLAYLSGGSNFTSLGGPSFAISHMSNGVMNASYNSKGAGDVTFYFTLGDDTLLTKTYVLYDTVWFDSNSANWTASNASTSYSNNIREMIMNSNTALLNPTVNNNPFFISCNDDFIVEFDYGGGNASLYFAVSGQLYNMGVSLNQARYNNKTIKLLVKPSEDKTEVYIDGVYFKTETNYRTFSGSNNCGLFFRTNNVSGVTVTFGNLKIYPA